MSIGMIALYIAAYLLLSRCAIGFFYAVTEGVNIAKSKNKAAFLVPPFGEMVLLFAIVHVLIYSPVVKISNMGIKVNKWREDKLVAERVLHEQREAYRLKLAQYGLTPEEVPDYIESDTLDDYITALKENGLQSDPVDIDAIRKRVRKEMKAAKRLTS